MSAWLRRWRRHPLLAAHLIATVSLGIAALAAVVSLTLAVAFQPLPFRDSEQLIEVWNRVQSGAPVESLSGAELLEIQEQTQGVFASVGGFLPLRMWLREEPGSSQSLRILRLEETALRALNVMPVLGRPIAAGAGSPEGLGSVWISHRLWSSRYGSRSSVVGETIRLAQNEAGAFETRSEIAGVLPPDIRIPSPTVDSPVDLWAVLPGDFKVRAAAVRAFFAVGRLRSDRTLADAQAVLTASADRRARVTARRYRPTAQSFTEIAYGPARRTMGLLAVGVGLVLLLAFANLASLTVAEGSRRRLELSIRASLGAGRWQLWRTLVAEHLALTACALALGLPLAWITLRSLTRLVVAADLAPVLDQPPGLNAYVLIGFAACALGASLLWATFIVRDMEPGPSGSSWRSARSSSATRLNAADRRSGIYRLAMLSIQACFGLALMVLAVSMARAYVRVTEVNLGPAPERTTFFRVSPTLSGALTDAQVSELTSQVRSLMQTLPDVEATAFADSFPPSGSVVSFRKADDAADPPRVTTDPVSVSHDYFSALGIPILLGRGFGDSDRYGGKQVAIIDMETARRNWTSLEEAVHAQIKIGGRDTYEVIGVAGSFGGYWAQVPVPMIYLSQNQRPSRTNAVIVRTHSSGLSVAEQARQVLRGTSIQVEMSAATTLQAGWQATATRPRARMLGMVLLGLIGVVLGAQGVYALAASNVAARRQELAIRTALGASEPVLMWLVLRPLIVAVAIGSAIGAAGIVAMQRLAPQWISAAMSEPAVPLALAFAALLAMAVIGGLVPARSAARATTLGWLRQ
jgi:putative ABC transport system permease protein